jgi:hypothetical protein
MVFVSQLVAGCSTVSLKVHHVVGAQGEGEPSFLFFFTLDRSVKLQQSVKNRLLEKSGCLRGIVIAHDFTTRALAASKPVPGIELQKYGA